MQLHKAFTLAFTPRMFQLLLLCAAFLPSCLKQPVLDTTGRPSTVIAAQADAELLRIADEARAGLPVFFRQLARAEAGEGNFSVKYPLPADEGGDVNTEHIWLTGIHSKDGRYYGKLAGTPVHFSGMKKGDTITFIADDITDWMYVKDGKIVGGFSIKYLLEQIPKDKRSEVQDKLLEMFE
jgi:uncharacterized protein YegJ (DUF2314 family)